MMGRISKITLAILATMGVSTSFADTTSLLQVYQQAQQNDTTFKNAESTYLSAKEALPLAFANLLPQVDVTANYTKANNSTDATHFDSKGYGASLSQDIFNWSDFSGVSKAKATLRQALATYEAAKQTLISTTVSDYLTVVQDAATVQYDHAYTNQLYQLLKQQEQKYHVGIIPVTDVYQAQSNYDAQLATNISDRNTLDGDIENLRALTGHAYTSIQGVSAALPLHQPNPNSMQSWVDTALKQNLGIVANKAALDIAKATVSGDRGAHLPTLQLQGQYNQNYFINKTKNVGPNNTPLNHNISSVALALSMPVFHGGALWTQTRADAYSETAAQDALDGSYRSTVATTRTSYLAILAAISGVQSAKQAYLSADKSLKATEAGYQVGTNTIVNVLQDMADRTKAEQSIVSNQVSYLNANVALKQEAGILNDRDIKAISKVLNQTVTLPNTLTRTSYTPLHEHVTQQNTTKRAPMTDAQKSAKAAAGGTSTSQATTDVVMQRIYAGNPAPATPAKTNATGPYSIQLFASNSQARAATFISSYLQGSADAFIMTHTVNGKTVYTVMVGHYQTEAAAQSAITKFSAATQRLDPWVKKIS